MSICSEVGALNLLPNVKPTKNVAGREAGRRLASSTHVP